jgi:UDP-glucose 4-epimerase
MSRAVLILGGAGFIGSHVAEQFVRAGDRVTVLDGLLPGTGGRRENLRAVLDRIELVPARVEIAGDLEGLVGRSDVIIDAMAWTAHRLAIRDPLRDLELNAASHLSVIRCLSSGAGKKVIFLGSRGQYGRAEGPITEDTPQRPEDVQGTHKLAAESYYRIYAGLHGFDAVSLRFGNCFGARQPMDGDDIGLIGGFARDLLAGRTVDVYGADRRRFLVYAPDVAEVVFQLSDRVPRGFSAFNYAGAAVSIGELGALLAGLAGRGACRLAPMPEELARTDVGDASFDDGRLRAHLDGLPATDLRRALAATMAHLRGEPA